MLIYHYDRETKEFISSEEAFESPKEKDVYLIPLNATSIKPPEVTENKIALFENKAWTIKDDFRGQWQVNIKTKSVSTINYIGSLTSDFHIVSSDVAEQIQMNPDKFEIVSGKLTDISDTQAYKNKVVLAKKKDWENQFIKTSLGWLRIDTTIGDLLSLFNSFEIVARINQKLDSNIILFYSTPDFSKEASSGYILSLQFWNKEMSYKEFMSLFSEVSQAYLTKFKGG